MWQCPWRGLGTDGWWTGVPVTLEKTGAQVGVHRCDSVMEGSKGMGGATGQADCPGCSQEPVVQAHTQIWKQKSLEVFLSEQDAHVHHPRC